MAQKFMLFENGTICITPNFARNIPDKQNGLKKKSYTIDRAIYRTIGSSAVNLWNRKKNNLTFFTLTFPFNPTEVQANECFCKFIDNLKKTYGLKNYITTKERGDHGDHLLHYHCIFDLPFTDIRIINKAWCNTFSSLAPFSGRAVIIPPKSSGGALVQSQERCVKYICKYVSKGINKVFEKPCVFISREILSKPRELTQEQIYKLQEQYSSKVFTYQFYTIQQFDKLYISKYTKFT